MDDANKQLVESIELFLRKVRGSFSENSLRKFSYTVYLTDPSTLHSEVKNLEDELCYSCQINDIRILTGSSSSSDFKRDFLHITNIHQKLLKHNFDISRLWCRKTTNTFSSINNDAMQIKIIQK